MKEKKKKTHQKNPAEVRKERTTMRLKKVIGKPRLHRLH